MDRLRVRVNFLHVLSVFLTIFSSGELSYVNKPNVEYTLDSASSSLFRPEEVFFEPARHRRDVAETVNHTLVLPAPPAAVPTDTSANATPGSNKKVVNATDKGVPTTPVTVTQTPLLGVNGSGQLHVTPGNMPKVSDPIVADDTNITEDVFIKETPERIAAAHNMSDLSIDNHDFYNSTFIGNLDFFNQYWANISIHKASIHAVLSNSYRRATSVQLSFDFPFYGHNIRNVTVATGGFIYTGEHVHNWLAATQYIAPMMANFDTTLGNDSVVKLYDDGEKFSAFWENVTLQEDPNLKFTFAVTLYKSGDIVFAYKDIPIDVQQINDTDHPVKVGISDAYLTDKIVFYVRRKTIYEYHRVSFKDHLISNHTILQITALPTCLQYDSCDSCLNHKTDFNCTWCPQIQKCSSGTDRNKQDWLLRKCEKTTIVNASSCVVNHPNSEQGVQTGNTAYTTDQQGNTGTDTVVKTADAKPASVPLGSSVQATPTNEAKSSIGGVLAAFVSLTVLCAAVAWVLYAFKNPHTRSGQVLIKYRPSQWNWRRGEARYTAATIHM